MTPSTRLVVTVPGSLDRVRADRAVAMLCDCSRSDASRLLAAGRVRLDGRSPTTASAPVRAGQELVVELEARRATPDAEPEVAFEVVFDDDHLIVVDKPTGVVVHPGAGQRTGTLVAGLLGRYPELAALPDGGAGEPDRPGIVHRLDRDTSGLLVVARSSDAYHDLVRQLAARTVERRYVARLEGHLPDDRGLIDAPIKRSARSPMLMTVAASGRPARTRYTVIERSDVGPPTTLAAVHLETGRTHQIRVHLAAIGHPVLGDRLYGGRSRAMTGPGGEYPRLMLHAAHLGVDHPVDGSRRAWDSEPPEGLRRSS